MDAPGVACRLWYVVLPLRDGGFLEVDQMSAREIFEAARPDGVIDLPQASTVFNTNPLCLLVEWPHYFLLCVKKGAMKLVDYSSWVSPPNTTSMQASRSSNYRCPRCDIKPLPMLINFRTSFTSRVFCCSHGLRIPQGLKGEHSPRTVIESLESDTWYQVSAVSERATGVFSRPSFTVARTHREPARLMDLIAAPVQGSTNSLRLRFRLDCSVVPTREMCGKSRWAR